MKILVLSDSHRNVKKMKAVVEMLYESMAAVIFLGDCCEDMQYFESTYTDLDFYVVRGNCDFTNRFPDHKTIGIGGKTIWISHGHMHSVKADYSTIVCAAEEKGVDACLFGHTHVPIVFKKGGILFMNPGSVSLPRGYYRESYGVLDITGDTISASVVEITPKGYKPISF